MVNLTKTTNLRREISKNYTPLELEFLGLVFMRNVLLIHGALGAKQDLQLLAESLKSNGLFVFSFSFSGHGRTGFADDFTITRFTKELKDFIVYNKLQPITVFGYSMGGFVALNLASTEAGLINKIITLGTKFNWGDVSVEKEIKQLNPDIIRQKVPALAKSLEEKHGPAWKDLMLKTASLMRDINSVQHLNAAAIKNISIPVQIGIGDKDQMVSFEETIETYKTLPNASMFMLPGCKHALETANLHLLSQVIVEFARLKNDHCN